MTIGNPVSELSWSSDLTDFVPEKPQTPEDWARVETKYAELCPMDRRKRFGQFMTPPAIALLMAKWVLGGKPSEVLDPAVGLGIFPWAIRRLSPDVKVTGTDIDPEMVAAAEHLNPELKVSQTDFLNWEPDHKFDGIICNPPYVRHHTAKLPDELYARYSEVIRERISRLTNIYALFLIEIAQRLKPGGRAAVITPAEYLNADFGVAVKRYLVENGLLSGLIIFDHATEVFGDALTTASIALIEKPEKAEPGPVRIIRVSDAEDIAQLSEALDSEDSSLITHYSSLDPSAKWQSLGLCPHPSPLPNGERALLLGDIARCCRGIATGANDYFTLSLSQAKELGLPRECLIPCITKSAQVKGTDFDDDALERLIAAEKKVFLVNTALDHPAVRDYIALGEAQGIHLRYLPAHRNPWHALEKRDPAPIWVTVFGRGSFRFIRNRTGALNLTTFHCIYPLYLPQGLSVDDLCDYLNSQECQQAIREQMRVYGGGLEKLEPRDVLRIKVNL